MSGVPIDWHVVLVGAWNPAILTPAGVAKRVLGLPPDSSVEVRIALDQLAIHVIHGPLIVSPSRERLIIQAAEPTANNLRVAAEAAARALRSLPETPVWAAGVNLHYNYNILPETFEKFFESPLDGDLSDHGHDIVSRQLKRGLKWRDATLNLELSLSDAKGKISFNFHRPNSANAGNDELAQWVTTTGEMVNTVDQLMKNIFGEHL